MPKDNHQYWDKKYRQAKMLFTGLLILQILLAIAVMVLWDLDRNCLLSAQLDDGSWSKEVVCR